MTSSTNKRVRKKKLSIKKISIFIVILGIITTILLNINNIRNIYLSNISGYNKEAVNTFIENDIYDDIKGHQYSKTLESIINTEYYNKEHLSSYLEISYIEDDTFLKDINILLDKGYTSKDINDIYSKLNDTSIDIILDYDYVDKLTDIINIDYFKEDKLERYLNYHKLENLDIETILTYVNIGLDKEYYTNVSDILKQDDILVLVNKYHRLSNNYEPSDLENVSSKYGNGKLRKVAREAFDEMCKNAKKDNITIYGGSGYRTYSHQQRLYNNYVNRDGKKEADTYSARPGYSEHQTGLSMDIMNGRWGYVSKTDKEYTWLINNSYKYGFILRYPEGKDKITGYMYEPWHYRYVGVDLATKIKEQNITYDEYVAKNS